MGKLEDRGAVGVKASAAFSILGSALGPPPKRAPTWGLPPIPHPWYTTFQRKKAPILSPGTGLPLARRR